MKLRVKTHPITADILRKVCSFIVEMEILNPFFIVQIVIRSLENANRKTSRLINRKEACKNKFILHNKNDLL